MWLKAVSRCAKREKVRAGADTSGLPGGRGAPGSMAPRGQLERMREQLAGSEFRRFNEQLYKCPSWKASQLLQRDPEALRRYMRNFREQTQHWPSQPVGHAASWLLSLASRRASTSRTAKGTESPLSVVDLGAGDGELASLVARSLSVRSFDFVSLNERVEACDISSLPIQSERVDVAVLCLALMGTNYKDFLAGALRA